MNRLLSLGVKGHLGKKKARRMGQNIQHNALDDPFHESTPPKQKATPPSRKRPIITCLQQVGARPPASRSLRPEIREVCNSPAEPGSLELFVGLI